MNGNLFYVLGVGLALLAVLTSFVGLRIPRFPRTTAAMVAIIGTFVVLIVATTTFAVRHSKDEEAHHEQEVGLPHATQEAEEEEAE